MPLPPEAPTPPPEPIVAAGSEEGGAASTPVQPHPLVALVQQTTTAKEDSAVGYSNLIIYLVLVGVTVLGFGIMGWLLARARREAAKLEVELRKKDEEQVRVSEDAKLTSSETYRQVAEARAKELDGQIQELKKKLEEQSAINDVRRAALDQATSWEDLGL